MMIGSIFSVLTAEQNARDTLAAIKTGLPCGDELYTAVRGKPDAYLKTYLRTIQKELERLNNASQ